MTSSIKSEERTNEQSTTLGECQNLIGRTLIYIHTFLKFYYRLLAYNFVPCCPRNHYYPEEKDNYIFKWTYRLSGNHYRVAMLLK